MVAPPIEPHPDGDLHQRDNSQLHRDWTAKVALRLRKLSTAPGRRWLLASASPPQAPAGRQVVLARHEVRPPCSHRHRPLTAVDQGSRMPTAPRRAVTPPAAVHSPAVRVGHLASSLKIPRTSQRSRHCSTRATAIAWWRESGLPGRTPTGRREVVGVRVADVVLDPPLGHHEVLRRRRPEVHQHPEPVRWGVGLLPGPALADVGLPVRPAALRFTWIVILRTCSRSAARTSIFGMLPPNQAAQPPRR
jgi:hypothetical protein